MSWKSIGIFWLMVLVVFLLLAALVTLGIFLSEVFGGWGTFLFGVAIVVVVVSAMMRTLR